MKFEKCEMIRHYLAAAADESRVEREGEADT
jgi:hypothetical protein